MNLEAHFTKAIDNLRDCPPDIGHEVAFVGRSNAGKSTAINALVRRKVAFVSKTPGRTQTINFYQCGPNRRLVDLPGYGYAAVPLKERARWGELISAYLQSRASLCGVILIMDARHPLTPLDRQLLSWFAPTAKPMHILLAKADKLTRRQSDDTLAAVSRTLSGQFPFATVQLFSGVTGLGVATAQKHIWQWLK